MSLSTCERCGGHIPLGPVFNFRHNQEDMTIPALRARIAELEAALEEIGCRTDHGYYPNRIDCPICKIVDRVIR